MRLRILTFLILILLVGGLLSAGGSSETGNTRSASDFGISAPADDHDDDHSHDEELTEPVFDPSLTETEDEGVFIDHHGNRVVNELYQKYEQDGLLVEFTVENFLGVGGRGGEVSSDIHAGERAVVKFKVSDAATETPLEGIQLMAWIDRLPADELDLSAGDGGCEDKVEGYLSGALTARPTLDLNSFFILAMNNDPSISVIDPSVDVVGMTQLFALIQLAQPGEDWALRADQEELWVTLPASDQIAVTEMDGFSLAQHLDGGSKPMRIAFQPDQRYVWVGNDAERERDSGVTVIDPGTRQIVEQISTGGGHHELAFSPDSRYAYVTNSESGRLSIIDTETLKVVEEVRTGREPAAVAVSETTGNIYVGDRSNGTIYVLDGQDFTVITGMETSPGLGVIGLPPSGNWGVATNEEAGQVIIFDTVSNQVTHVAEVAGAPDQISFSPETAYIRVREAAQIIAIPLADINPNNSLSLNMVPVGEQAPGFFPSMSLANAIFPIPGQQAMVVANPADDQVYYYPEGATSSSGSFQGHTLFPRAVQVVDRSLKEEAPGVYGGRVRIPAEGEYLVAVMLSDPFLIHCFEFTVKPNEDLDSIEAARLNLEMVDGLQGLEAGKPATIRFRLTDPNSGAPVDDLTDVLVVVNQTVGNWSNRMTAVGQGDGVYEISLTPPRAGLYSLFFGVPSRNLDFGQFPMMNLQVTAGN